MPVRSSCWWCIPSCTSPPEPSRSPRIQWSQIPALGGVWGIENRLHWVRDVTFDEDRSQVRTGAAPQVLAGLRNLVISLVRRAGHSNVAAALRRHNAHLSKAFDMMGFTYQAGE